MLILLVHNFCHLLLMAFDEGERIFNRVVSTEITLAGLWTGAAGIDRDAMRFQRLGAILDWLYGTYRLDFIC